MGNRHNPPKREVSSNASDMPPYSAANPARLGPRTKPRLDAPRNTPMVLPLADPISTANDMEAGSDSADPRPMVIDIRANPHNGRGCPNPNIQAAHSPMPRKVRPVLSRMSAHLLVTGMPKMMTILGKAKRMPAIIPLNPKRSLMSLGRNVMTTEDPMVRPRTASSRAINVRLRQGGPPFSFLF